MLKRSRMRCTTYWVILPAEPRWAAPLVSVWRQTTRWSAVRKDSATSTKKRHVFVGAAPRGRPNPLRRRISHARAGQWLARVSTPLHQGGHGGPPLRRPKRRARPHERRANQPGGPTAVA